MRGLRRRLPLNIRLRQYPKQRRLPNLPQPNNPRLHKPEIVAHHVPAARTPSESGYYADLGLTVCKGTETALLGVNDGDDNLSKDEAVVPNALDRRSVFPPCGL
jgi:hypothetical protein